MIERSKFFFGLAGLVLLALTVLPDAGEAGIFDQIKKAGNLANEAVKGVTDQVSNQGPNQSPSQSSSPSVVPDKRPTSAAGGSSAAPSVAVSAPRAKPAPHPSGYPPGLMFSTVLNGVQIDYKTGKLYLDKIQAVFLPTPPTQSNSIYPYDPFNGGGLIWAVLKDGAGNEAAKFEFTGENIKEPYWLLSVARCAECDPGNRTSPLVPGDYVLDFYVEGDHFYHFPFTVDMLKPESAFDGGNFYFINGDWEKWGYLYYFEARPDQNLTWKVWLRNKAADKRGLSGEVDVTLYRGGTPIAKSRPATYTLKPGWIRFQYELTEPMKGTSGGRYFKASDLLAKDGNYTLKMVVNGKPYGTWPFAVQGGKLAYTGRTVRGKADPLTFIEGGKDAWWYEMK